MVDITEIRIKDLPLDNSPSSGDFIPLDGTTTRRANLTTAINAARPFASQAEAEAGTSTTKAMNPLRVAQAIALLGAANVTAAEAAQAAAELAAEGALAASPLYASTAAGIAATSSGDYFFVIGSNYSVAQLYKNVATVATYQSLDIPSKALLDHTVGQQKAYQLIGRPLDATLVTGSALGNTTIAFGNDPFTHDVLSVDYTYFGLGVGTAYFSVWSKSGTTYTFQGEISFTTATGLQTISLAIAATAGWVPGLFANTLIAAPSADADGGGIVDTAGHNTTNFTDSSFNTGIRPQHRIKAYYQSVTETRVAGNASTTDTILENLEGSTIVGRPTGTTLVTGSAASNATLVHKLAPLATAKKLRQYDYFGLAVGTARLIDFSISGDTMTPVQEYSFVTATGEQSIYPDWDVAAGHVIGVYPYDGAGLIAVTVAPGDSLGYVADSGHSRAAFTSTSVVTSVLIQHRFTFGAQTVTEARVADIEATADNATTLAGGLATAVIAASGDPNGVEYLGASSPVTGDAAAGVGTYMLGAIYAGAGDRTVDSFFDQIQFYATGSGSGTFGVWSRDDGTDTNTAVKTVNLTWTGSGLKTFTEGVDWADGYFSLSPGQYFGFYNDGTIKYLTVANAGYYFASGSQTSFVDATKTTNFEIQCHARVRFRSINEGGTAGEIPLPTVFDVVTIVEQSNGLGTAVDYGTTPRNGIAYMWRSATNTLAVMADPTGNLGTPKGSCWPAFATKYFDLTGRGIILVNMARGGSGLVAGTGGAFGNWSPSGTLRQGAIDALTACTTYLDANGFAWQMGGVIGAPKETDAIAIDAGTVSGAQHLAALGELRTFLETGTGMGSKMPWILIEMGTLQAGATTGALAIRAAERAFVRSSDNTWLGWTGAKNLEARDTAHGSAIYMEPDHLHYTQLSQTECGEALAQVAAIRFAGQC